MANVLSLALKINADASGLKLDPVEKALKRLGEETDKVSGIFDKFAGTSEAAAKAQEQTTKALEDLIQARREGSVTAEEFAKNFERIRDAATQEAAALQRAAQVTEANLSPLERYDAAVAELAAQLQAGRISQETYTRATEKAAKGLTDAERAARGLEAATEKIDDNAGKTTLQFNELSGIFATLPGPIGNVAGRISGLSSAVEGLGRIFAGGLSQGIGSLGASVAALVNPFTIAVAGITAFGAAATAVASGLQSLESQTERLQNAATKLGVSFRFMETLEQAASMSGISFESVNGAMSRLLKTLAGADEESKQATAALGRLGITLDDLSGKDTEGQVRLIGERLKNIEDPAKRAAAAMALFGKSGADLLPFFDNLPIAEKTLDRFNARLSSLDVTRVLALGDSFDAVSASVRGIGNELLTPFIGAAQSVADSMASVFASFGKVLGNVLDILSPVTSALGLFANVAGQVGSVLVNVIAVALEPFAAVGRGIASVFDAMSRAATEIFGRINDVINGFGQFFQFNGALEVMNAAFSKLWETLERVGTIVTTAFGKVGTFIGGAVKSFLDFTGLTPAIEAIGGIISKVFGGVSSVFSTIANAIGGTVGRLLTLAESFLGIERSTKSASDATGSLAGSADSAAKSADDLSKSQKKAADEAKRRAEEAAKIASEEAKRVNELLDLQEPIDKLSQDITATNNEIVRTEAALADARAAGATEEANRLSARLAKLDQLQQSLIDRSEEAAQGFEKGFADAFQATDKGISTLIDKSTEFGQEGFNAALKLQEGIAKAQEQVKDGILNKAGYEKEVERQKDLYEDRVKGLQEAAKITEKAYEKEAELLQRQFEIEKERAEELADIRTGSVQINDIRSGGVSQFFDTLQEDPAVAEAKKQRKELEKIRQEISKLNAEKIEILAGTG
jgi:phage-related protein